MIYIRKLYKAFPSDFSLSLNDIKIETGDRVALIGLNGSGKSTLLKILAGFMRPDQDDVICDTPKDRIGYQPQSPYAFRGDAEANIRLAPRAPKDLSRFLQLCETQTLLHKKMSELSGGEKQRVFLTRMLAGGYDLLLLDEPLSAADLQTGERLSKVLADMCTENGKTLVFSTHLPKQAFTIANKILLLDNGKVAEFGGIAQMKTPKSVFGKAFFSLYDIGESTC